MDIKITVNGQVLSAKRGEILSDVLIRNGISHPHPCGGRGVCKKCEVIVDGKAELACRYAAEHDITVKIFDEGEMVTAGGIESCEGTLDGTDLVLDLGTTTLALALISRKEKRTLRVITAKNAQRAIGADVISRIEYCKKNGVSAPWRMISEQVSKMISDIGAVGIKTLHTAGNTTMLHILAGEDPSPMGTYPYTPAFLDEKVLDAGSLGIQGVEHVHLLPSISAFVGADLVAGINYVGLPDKKHRMLVDLGTNAEVILLSRDRIIATAAAAGPCFEGANISCGMSATHGAVYAFDGKDIKTVGDCAPMGLCGTGLVDAVAYLLKNGIIDETGYMEDEEFQLCDGVTLTQGDIRQYQLAKSAICSAIVTLMRQNGVEFSDIESLYISGGFSSKINIGNAAFTGLIPRELKDVCVSVGNSALLGSAKAVFDQNKLSHIVSISKYADLSTDSVFSELFMQNIGFDNAE